MTTFHRSAGRYVLLTTVLTATLFFWVGSSQGFAQGDDLFSPGEGLTVPDRGVRPRRADALDYVTIDVREKDLREVLQGIGRQVDVNIVADPEVDEKVTITIERVEVTT